MWENLKSVVNEVIKPNDNREITGEKHNSTLRTVINSLGKYAQFAGLAFKNTNPGTPDGPVFYFAAFKGVYINFNRIEVEENEVAILNYNNNKWEKIVIGYSPIAPATIEDIRLTAFIDAVNSNNTLKTNFEFKQDSILGVQLPFLHAAVSHIDADGQLIKGKPTSEVLIPVPLAEASTDADTPGKHGFMSYQDKDLLYSIPNYTISGKKISENPILTYDDIQGVAYLGEDGKIPSSLLPSYVDDVLEYDSIDNFPLIGEGGKIYLDKKTNLAYRWSGTVYVSISSSIALGETSSTAYAGDKGKKNADDIADLKANKADKTSVYTKEEVDYLIEHFKLPDHIKAITFSVDGILVSKNEDGNLVIGGNVIVEGGISMYGPGQFGDTIMDYIVVDGTSIKIIDGKLTVDPNFVGGGTVKGIKVNGYTYDEVDTNGYITIPDYPTELAWNSITGKPSTFMPSAHTHKIEDITDIADASVSHATTADRLKKEIMIWGQPFDGSTDVEGAISNVDVINMANADTVISLYIKNGVLFIEGDLAVTGGITMYASDGVKSGMIDQVLAVLDPTIFSKQGDYITITGEIGGGTVKAVKVGSTQYDPDSDGVISLPEYPTVTTLEWDNILNKPSTFAPSSHTHSSITIPVCSSLNGNSDVFSVEYVGGNNSVVTKPSGVDAFGVMRLRTAVGWYGQIMMSANTAPGMYYRNANGLSSSVGWKKLLDSGNFGDYAAAKSHTHAISQITNLQATLNGKAAASHTHAIADITNISSASVSYASSAGNADTLDGNHASAFAAASHTHSYLPLSGGTMTGDINLHDEVAVIWSPIFSNYMRMPFRIEDNGYFTGINLYNSNNNVFTKIGVFTDKYGQGNDINSIFLYPNATPKIGTNIIWHAGNDGSGSGLDADTCDGLHVHGGRNYEANKIVRTDGNGYIQCGYINSSYGNEGNNSSPARVWGTNGSDNYMRTYLTSALSVNYAASAGNASTASNADTLDGYHYSSFAWASHTHSYLPLSGGTLTTSDTVVLELNSTSNFQSCLLLELSNSLKSQFGFVANEGTFIHDYTSQAQIGVYAYPFFKSNEGKFRILTENYIRNTNKLESDTVVFRGVNGEYFRVLNDYGIGITDKNITTTIVIDNQGTYGKIYHNAGHLCIQEQYYVGIGTTSPSAKLHVSGDILASGGITMYSDLRKKNILSNEVLSVKEIAAAPLFKHTYKSDDNQYIHVGTSAQYWSGIHEDWFTRKDGEGYYQMELQNLGVAIGISLAREIVKYESKTDKKIRLMRKKINDLEARIKELEGSREERRTA